MKPSSMSKRESISVTSPEHRVFSENSSTSTVYRCCKVRSTALVKSPSCNEGRSVENPYIDYTLQAPLANELVPLHLGAKSCGTSTRLDSFCLTQLDNTNMTKEVSIRNFCPTSKARRKHSCSVPGRLHHPVLHNCQIAGLGEQKRSAFIEVYFIHTNGPQATREALQNFTNKNKERGQPALQKNTQQLTDRPNRFSVQLRRCPLNTKQNQSCASLFDTSTRTANGSKKIPSHKRNPSSQPNACRRNTPPCHEASAGRSPQAVRHNSMVCCKPIAKDLRRAS